MTFAVPLFLAAALAAVIPVLLHLISRQRAKNMPFPTLRFLRASVEKTRRRRRITDVLLMLVRAALLVLIALGLARPTLTNLKTLFGTGAASAVALVVDNSASMGTIDHDRERFQTAMAAAGQVMEQLRDGDQVALFPTCGVPFAQQGKLDRSQDQVRQMLAGLKLSYERADVAARVLDARKLLARCDAVNKQIFVVSDMQRVSWESLRKQVDDAAKAGRAEANLSEEERKARDIPLIVVDCHRAPKPNVAVVGLALEAAVPVAGLPIKATVELVNSHSAAATRLVELYLDGNKEAVSPALTIAGESRLKHDFQFCFKSGGLHRGEVRLAGDDGNKLDDRRFFSMEVDQGLPIAVVAAERKGVAFLEDTFYIESALGRGKSDNWALKLSSLTVGQLATEPLDAFKVIYLVNCPAPDDATAARLRAYLERGGNLFWVCGDNVRPEAYNAANQRTDGRLLPCPLGEVRVPRPGEGRESWSIGFLDKRHRALAQLTEPASLYQKVLVYQHVRIDASGTKEAQVLARLDDGEPLLVQRRVERGSVTMLGTSCHRTWTNLPLRPIFVPLLARLTFELCGTAAARYEGIAGVPLVIPLDGSMHPTGVEIAPPSGEMIRRSVQDASGKFLASLRYADTHEIGIYTVRLLQAVGAKPMAYAVNVDPDEAEGAKLRPEELQELLGRTPLVFAENPDDLSSTFQWLRQGKSLWTAVLAFVLAALVFETFLSNRLTPKRDADVDFDRLPPGLRRLARKGRERGVPSTEY
jgi:hypothetical protein